MARLDTRTLERLEAKHPKVSVKSDRRDDLEEFFRQMENFQAALNEESKMDTVSVLPTADPEAAIEESYDPVLEEYFEELREQEAARDAALRRKEQHG
jgi:hypothetical protein